MEGFNLTKYLVLDEITSKVVSDRETDKWDKFESFANLSNEISISLHPLSEPALKFKVIFRTYNEGVAFRYEIPEQQESYEGKSIFEQTEFNLQIDNQNCFYLFGVDISTEDIAIENIALSSLSLPVNFKYNDTYIGSIHETDSRGFKKMRLYKSSNQQCKLKNHPIKGLNYSYNEGFKSSWRIIYFSNNE